MPTFPGIGLCYQFYTSAQDFKFTVMFVLCTRSQVQYFENCLVDSTIGYKVY